MRGATKILNVDAGELEDEPAELYALADLVHIACGGHAGDAPTMTRALGLAARAGARAGAHPSYEDRAGFGRVRLDVPADMLRAQLETQLRAIRRIADGLGVPLVSMKPHGALYHAATTDRATAEACVDATAAVLGVVDVVGPAGGGALRDAAEARGLPYRREAFADRGVLADGSLVPRGQPGALVRDPAVAAARARELAARDDVDTICLHGDTEGAVAIARAVRTALGPRT